MLQWPSISHSDSKVDLTNNLCYTEFEKDWNFANILWVSLALRIYLIYPSFCVLGFDHGFLLQSLMVIYIDQIFLFLEFNIILHSLLVHYFEL